VDFFNCTSRLPIRAQKQAVRKELRGCFQRLDMVVRMKVR
jgi:hypothetical protein